MIDFHHPNDGHEFGNFCGFFKIFFTIKSLKYCEIPVKIRLKKIRKKS